MTQAGKNGRATILDVAREANVSVGSVSNVLNGTRPVSRKLREQVLAAATRLNFSINTVAATLRRRRSGVIGFCTTYATTVYLRELADELDKMATDNGYDLIQVFTRQDPELELRRVRSLIARQVDGLILLPSLQPAAALEAVREAGTPLVIVDRRVDPRFDTITVANHAAMGLVVKRLRALGHRRLLFIPQNRWVMTTQERIKALEDAAATCAEFSFEILERGQEKPHFVEALRMTLAKDMAPTAIVTGNSSVALWTVEALQQLGRRWPDDVSLVTFDEPEWTSLLSPPVASIAAPTRAMAERVWQALVDRLAEADRAPVDERMMATLDMRGSIGPAPPNN
ncbi:LacI family DNA-binding transcriptional regulator [Aureimonas fodinaquatilis]|nr:LacI family DNA-binding transcriptional regulator [Aureimonas fodinaquatilis]